MSELSEKIRKLGHHEIADEVERLELELDTVRDFLDVSNRIRKESSRIWKETALAMYRNHHG